MLEIDSKTLTITISQGDIFDMTFDIEELALDASAEVYLTVKKDLADKDPILLKQCTSVNVEKNQIRVTIESPEMETLPVGKYYYDLLYKVGKNKRTLCYPLRLDVVEVVHNE